MCHRVSLWHFQEKPPLLGHSRLLQFQSTRSKFQSSKAAQWIPLYNTSYYHIHRCREQGRGILAYLLINAHFKDAVVLQMVTAYQHSIIKLVLRVVPKCCFLIISQRN